MVKRNKNLQHNKEIQESDSVSYWELCHFIKKILFSPSNRDLNYLLNKLNNWLLTIYSLNIHVIEY